MKHLLIFLFLVSAYDTCSQENPYPWGVHIYYAPATGDAGAPPDYERSGYSYRTGLGLSREIRSWEVQIGTAYSSMLARLKNRDNSGERIEDHASADTTYSIRNTHRYIEFPIQVLYKGFVINRSDRYEAGIGGGISLCMLQDERAVWTMHPTGQAAIPNFRNDLILDEGFSTKLFFTLEFGVHLSERSHLVFQAEYGIYNLPDAQKMIIGQLNYYAFRAGYAFRF